MNRYTPINIYRVNRKARELLKKIDQQSLWSPNVLTVPLMPEQFEWLLETIPEDRRHDYQNKIPYNGKSLLRIGK